MFGKKKASQQENLQAETGAVKQSRFAKELKLNVNTLDFGFNTPQEPYNIGEAHSTEHSFAQEHQLASTIYPPEDTGHFETPDFSSQQGHVTDSNTYQNDYYAAPEENIDTNQPSPWQSSSHKEAPIDFEDYSTVGSLDTLPVDDQAIAQQFTPPETDFYSSESNTQQSFQDITQPVYTSEDWQQPEEHASSWSEAPSQDAASEVSYQTNDTTFDAPTSIDSAYHVTDEIPPVELNPGPADDFSSHLQEPFSHPEIQPMPESSGEFLDQVNDNFYPNLNEDYSSHVEADENSGDFSFGAFSNQSISDAEDAFEETGHFLFPEASVEEEPLAPSADIFEATQLPPTDITTEHTQSFDSTSSEQSDSAFTSFWGDATQTEQSPLDESNAHAFDPLSTPINKPDNVVSINSDPLSVDPLNNNSAVNEISLDPLSTEPVSQFSLNPQEESVDSFDFTPTPVAIQQTEIESSEVTDTLNPDNLQVVASHPLIEDKSIMLVEGNGQMALMGQVGYGEDAMVAIIKLFTHNPLAANQTFTAVKEASAGSKHMFLTQVGDWQGIVSCDDRIVALHTELS